MSVSESTLPELFGILHRHLPGDESLLRLGQQKLDRAGMGAEIYPNNVDEAIAQWRYAPAGVHRHMLHLPRHWNVFAPADRDQIVAFALALPDRIRGLVFHDHRDWPARADELAGALLDVGRRLADLPGKPMLFLEYAAGLALDDYAHLLERIVSLPQIGAGIDTGHVTIFASHEWLKSKHPGFDAKRVDSRDPALATLAEDFNEAAAYARLELVQLVDRVAVLGKPMHFHLHDGHLLSRLSRYGVSDHLPFGERIPVSTAFSAEGSVSTIIGADGLRDVLQTVRAHLSTADVSLTLEIHPSLRLTGTPLGEWSSLFSHWKNLVNAELTCAWLDQVTEQAALVRRLWADRPGLERGHV